MNNLFTSLNLNFTEKVWMHRTSLKTWTLTTWMWLLFWLSCPFISVCAYCISTMLDIFSRLQDHMMTQVCLRPVSTCRMAAITSAVLSAPAPAPASPVTLLEAR